MVAYPVGFGQMLSPSIQLAATATTQAAGCGTKGEDAKEEVKKELKKETQVEEVPKSQIMRSLPKATEDGTNPGWGSLQWWSDIHKPEDAEVQVLKDQGWYQQ